MVVNGITSTFQLGNKNSKRTQVLKTLKRKYIANAPGF